MGWGLSAETLFFLRLREVGQTVFCGFGERGEEALGFCNGVGVGVLRFGVVCLRLPFQFPSTKNNQLRTGAVKGNPTV